MSRVFFERQWLGGGAGRLCLKNQGVDFYTKPSPFHVRAGPSNSSWNGSKSGCFTCQLYAGVYVDVPIVRIRHPPDFHSRYIPFLKGFHPFCLIIIPSQSLKSFIFQKKVRFDAQESDFEVLGNNRPALRSGRVSKLTKKARNAKTTM